MLASNLRGLAVLALLSLAPYARGTVITFGPQHTEEFLDVTISIRDGHWVPRYHPFTGLFERYEWVLSGPTVYIGDSLGWIVRAFIGENSGSVEFFAPPLQDLPPRYSYGYVEWGSAAHPPEIPNFGAAYQSGVFFPSRYTWIKPPVLAAAERGSVRYLWNVPDQGNSAMLLGVALAGLLFYRRRRDGR
jgi:hypothetical protein